MVSFAEGGAPGDKEDEWVETHAGRSAYAVSLPSSAKIDKYMVLSLFRGWRYQRRREIDDIPDDEPETVTSGMNALNLGNKGSSVPTEIPDMDDIPDMEEEGLEGEDDAAAVVSPQPESVLEIISLRCTFPLLMRVRTFTLCSGKLHETTCSKTGSTT